MLVIMMTDELDPDRLRLVTEPGPSTLDTEISKRVTAAVRRADDRLAATLGEIGWNAYAESVGGVAFNGDPLPEWRKIRDPKIRKAWGDAANAIAKTIAGMLATGIPADGDQPAAEPERDRVVIVWRDASTSLGTSAFHAEAIVDGRPYGVTAITLIGAIAGLRGNIAIGSGRPLAGFDFELSPPCDGMNPNTAGQIGV